MSRFNDAVRIAVLENALRMVLNAFSAHRTETHRINTRDCETCARSTAAIEAAWKILRREEP